MWRNVEKELFESSKIFSCKDSMFVDATWCDNIGLENDLIAAASLEGYVCILQKSRDDNMWKEKSRIQTHYTPHKVVWNGTILCVSTINERDGTNQTELYKEPIIQEEGATWELISIINDNE